MRTPAPNERPRAEMRAFATPTLHSRTPPHAQLFTRDGEISLSARSTHYMWRDEAQPLIAEGVLTKVSDE